MKNKVVNIVVLASASKFRMFACTVYIFVFCPEVSHGAYA